MIITCIKATQKKESPKPHTHLLPRRRQGGSYLAKIRLVVKRILVFRFQVTKCRKVYVRTGTYFFRSLLRKAFPADIREVFVSACTQEAPNLRCCFLKRRLTNTPRRLRLADGQLSSPYPPSPNFSSLSAASVMMFCFPPASSSTPSRPSVPLEAKLLKAPPVDIRKVFVCPPALRKLRIYDVVFSNHA